MGSLFFAKNAKYIVENYNQTEVTNMTNEENKVEEIEEIEEPVKETPAKPKKDPDYTSAFLVGFIGGAATALGKCAVDWAIPKIKEASAKAAEKRKAKKEERKKARLAKLNEEIENLGPVIVKKSKAK